jgi:ribonucleoside-diphosphate reductase alpha chain
MMNVVATKLSDKDDHFDPKTYGEIEQAILGLDVMPSMRAVMTAGPALERDNTAGYNCSYLPVDDPRSFDEAMFILLCGTGVGFSVERQYITKLPEVPAGLAHVDYTIIVEDSKEGWAFGLRELVAQLYNGHIPKWDVSKVRPAGAKLKTFGGRASGPAPLIDLFNFFVRTFVGAKGRKLSSIECHDLMCKIGEVVVVGGVRRSAMISLSNLSDDRMRHAKSGNWWENNPQRALANNSVSYTEKPDALSFMREWMALVESGSGERGIFNRQASKKQAAKNGRRDPNFDFGTNPCSEIILRPYQFC